MWGRWNANLETMVIITARNGELWTEGRLRSKANWVKELSAKLKKLSAKSGDHK